MSMIFTTDGVFELNADETPLNVMVMGIVMPGLGQE